MQSKSMENRKSLVIGGGQGIGRATALLLAQAGSNVAIVDTESNRSDSVAMEVRSLGVTSASIVTDVTSEEGARRSVDQAWEELGGLDSVVNIVGSSSWGTLLELDEETWERDFSVNLKHHWYVAKNAARRWIDAEQEGALCVVGSVSGLFSAKNHGAYGAAKAGLLSLVRTAAEEWWPHDIRVNAVVPGTVLTPRIEAAWRDGSVLEPDADVLGRMALPEDIAQSIYFLVSDMSRRITGQSIVVDGGATTKFPFPLS